MPAAAILVAAAVLTLVAGCGTTTAPPSAASASPAAATGSGVTVPLSIPDDLSAIPGVDVVVGGVTLHVKVDTGSTGLRVNAAKVAGAAMRLVGPARPYAFASGVQLHGDLAEATLGLGSARSTGPVRFEVIRSAGCLPSRPDCVTGGGGGAFDGIIGLSPRSAPDLDNPLWSLGALGHAYAVHLAPGGASTLVLGAPASGFVLEKLGPDPDPPAGAGSTRAPSWEAATDLCADSSAFGGKVCGRAVVDTGNPILDGVHVPGAADRRSPPGTPVTLSTADGRWTASYTPTRGQIVELSSSAAPGALGRQALAHTDLRYDLDAGTIGLRAHG